MDTIISFQYSLICGCCAEGKPGIFEGPASAFSVAIVDEMDDIYGQLLLSAAEC